MVFKSWKGQDLRIFILGTPDMAVSHISTLLSCIFIFKWREWSNSWTNVLLNISIGLPWMMEVWYYRILCVFSFSFSNFMHSETGKYVLLFYLHWDWTLCSLLVFVFTKVFKLHISQWRVGLCFSRAAKHIPATVQSQRGRLCIPALFQVWKRMLHPGGWGMLVAEQVQGYLRNAQKCTPTTAAEMCCELWLPPGLGGSSHCWCSPEQLGQIKCRGFGGCERETRSEVWLFSPAFHPFAAGLQECCEWFLSRCLIRGLFPQSKDFSML